MTLWSFIEAVLLAAIVSAGFALLFSVPKRTLIATALLGALGLAIRLVLLQWEWSLLSSTFMAALAIGACSMLLSWRFHAPCIVFSLPAVIPMVPGVFAFRTMLGILEFTRLGVLDLSLLTQIMSNGLNTAFLFLCLAVGVSLPNLLLRGRSIRSVFGLYHLNQRGGL